MSDAPDIVTLQPAPLAPAEEEFAREGVALLDRKTLLLTADSDMAALRLDPSLRAQVVDGGNVTELQALIGEGAANA